MGSLLLQAMGWAGCLSCTAFLCTLCSYQLKLHATFLNMQTSVSQRMFHGQFCDIYHVFPFQNMSENDIQKFPKLRVP